MPAGPPMPARSRTGLLRGWLLRAQWRAQPGRTLTSIAAVAIGVALALAIHLVNATALSSFQQALGAINGEADLRVSAPAGLLDEAVLDRVASFEVDGSQAVRIASPVLDLMVQIRPLAAGEATASDATARNATAGNATAGNATANNATVDSTATRAATSTAPAPARSLRIIATDLLSARAVTPALVPGGPPAAADRIWLSAAAWRQLELPPIPADPPETPAAPAAPLPRLDVITGAGLRQLQVAGLAEGIADEALALMDLGSAQWAFGLVGQLSRLDLRLVEGQSASVVQQRLVEHFGPAVLVTPPSDDGARMSNISRAYRVNLDMLAFVALLTGAFIVFAAMSLAALRQQPVFALFTLLGAPPAFPALTLLGQASWIGAVGALAGVAGGVGLAQGLLSVVGGDLGGGYFQGSRPTLDIRWTTCAIFAGLGWLTAVAGAALPAFASRQLPAIAILRNGAIQALEAPTMARRRLIMALALFAAGLALALAPPVNGLPLPAYLAIAVLLVAGVLATPTVIGLVTAIVEKLAGVVIWRQPPAWLALAYQRRASASIAIALAGVVASFALAVAMVVMVSSFRASVDDWLDTVLPADWYVRLASTSVPVGESLQARITAEAAPSRVEFIRARQLIIDPLSPAVTLLARDLASSDALAARLPLTGQLLAASPRHGPDADHDLEGFVSEAMVSRHGFHSGEVHSFIVDGRPVRLRVRGVWRDYARQGGSIAVTRDDYRRLIDDPGVTDLAIWPGAGVDGRALVDRLRDLDPLLAAGDWRSATELRRVSLAIFDRSFAITHVLEAVAIFIGLFGVAATYAAQALTRAREFGMLRHLGVGRRGVVAQLAIEATIGTLIAVAWGSVIGLAIALVLVERINPLSFHWTMDFMVPWPLLAGVALALVATAVATAMIATRRASSGEPIAALSRDA